MCITINLVIAADKVYLKIIKSSTKREKRVADIIIDYNYNNELFQRIARARANSIFRCT